MKSQVLKVVLLSGLIFSGSALAVNCKDPQTPSDVNQCASIDLGFDCEHPDSQIAENQCINSAVEIETKRLNKTYKKLQKVLEVDIGPGRSKQFKEVELAWIKYKDISCQYYADSVSGALYAPILGRCLLDETRERIKRLQMSLQCDEMDQGCR